MGTSLEEVGVGRLTIDATVSTVRAPPLLLGHVDLDVRDV